MTRRTILQHLGGAGIASALVTANSQGSGFTAAGRAALVVLPFQLTVRQGPSAGLRLEGLIGLVTAPEGAIDRGLFVWGQNRQVGTPAPVVGQANGRAVNLLLQLPQGPVYGVGTSSETLIQAVDVFDPETWTLRRPFLLGGPFVGPLAGDSGDWEATPPKEATIDKKFHDILRSVIQTLG